MCYSWAYFSVHFGYEYIVVGDIFAPPASNKCKEKMLAGKKGRGDA